MCISQSYRSDCLVVTWLFLYIWIPDNNQPAMQFYIFLVRSPTESNDTYSEVSEYSLTWSRLYWTQRWLPYIWVSPHMSRNRTVKMASGWIVVNNFVWIFMATLNSAKISSEKICIGTALYVSEMIPLKSIEISHHINLWCSISKGPFTHAPTHCLTLPSSSDMHVRVNQPHNQGK